MTPNQKTFTREESRHVNTVLNMMEVFDCFSMDESELSLTSLSNKTGIHKSRLSKICGALVFRRYLSRDQKTLKFSLGPQLMVLGRIFQDTTDLEKSVRPVIRMLSEKTEETASLFVIQGTRRLCLVKEDGNHPLRYVNADGDFLDLHRGAGGIVLLAYASEEKRNRILAALSMDPAMMLPECWLDDHKEELREVRSTGYVISHGKVLQGVAAIAAPVFDYSGECWASIAIAGPVQRFTSERCQVLLDDLTEAAAELSSLMGYDAG